MLIERTHPSGTFVHQLPSGGSSGASLSFVSSSLSLLLLQLHTSICFGLFCQCRLVVCIVITVEFLSGKEDEDNSSINGNITDDTAQTQKYLRLYFNAHAKSGTVRTVEEEFFSYS